MSELDRYLLPTETAVVIVRRHWASLVRSGSIFIGCQLAGMFVLSFIGDVQLFSILGVSVLLGSLLWFGWVIGDWWVERFVITDKRVLLATGLLTKRVAIMPLSKVTDMTYERTLFGRILGYGVFVMESAGQDQALSRIDYLPKPNVLYHDVSALLFGPKMTTKTGRTTRPEPDGGQTTRPLPRL
jgi:uncharacterized membrane protein YdbT with pleckstrin-like domain